MLPNCVRTAMTEPRTLTKKELHRQALAEARKEVQSKLLKGYVVQAYKWDGLLADAPEWDNWQHGGDPRTGGHQWES